MINWNYTTGECQTNAEAAVVEALQEIAEKLDRLCEIEERRAETSDGIHKLMSEAQYESPIQTPETLR
jgi:hypothetical protein